jgi:hypothetical protein
MAGKVAFMNDAEYASKCESIEEWNARRPERMKRFQEKENKRSEERQALRAQQQQKRLERKSSKIQMGTSETKPAIGNSRS